MNKANKWGWTALHFACTQGREIFVTVIFFVTFLNFIGHKNVVRALILAGADINKATNEGIYTVIMIIILIITVTLIITIYSHARDSSNTAVCK